MIKTSLAALGLMAGLALPLQAQESPIPGLDREALGDEIRAYLLENPEVIYEAIQVLEQRRRNAEASAREDLVKDNLAAVQDDGYSNVAGNPDGSVTMVEFFDYRCGYCKRAHDVVLGLVADDGDIRFIRKEFPILGPDSEKASRAAMAAQLQDDPEKYVAFSDRLMMFNGPLNDAVIDRLAERSGLDVGRMRADMQSETVSSRIAQNLQLAQTLGIGGTPTFIIGTEVISGAVPAEQLQAAVDRARDAAAD